METVAWVTPEDVTYALDGSDGLKVILAPTGRFAPPARLIEDQVPFQPGVRLRSVEHGARDLTWPAVFRAASETALRTSQRDWVARFDPARGNGRLSVTGPDGMTRELNCVVVDGLDLDEAVSNPRAGWCKTVLSFRAPYPYWQATIDELETWTATESPQWFPWSYPISFGASDVFSTQSITVLGDVPTFPVWTVVGPGDSLMITNVTTGRQFGWTGTLGAHETLTIDTRPAEVSITPKRATRNDGSNQMGSVTPYDFWPLEPGDQEIEVLFASTDIGSQVDCNYRPQYLTA